MHHQKHRIYLLLLSVALLHTLQIHGQGVEIAVNGQIKNVKTPTEANDLANKAYMDSVLFAFAIEFNSNDLPSLFSGQELLDKGFTVQELLDLGYSPIDIVTDGIALNSLYGKTYQGGLIFYIDDQDTIPGIQGLVAAPSDWHGKIGPGVPDDGLFGCSGIDIKAVMVNDTAIGTGQANTTRIIALGCSVGNKLEPDAPNLCNDLILDGYSRRTHSNGADIDGYWFGRYCSHILLEFFRV